MNISLQQTPSGPLVFIILRLASALYRLEKLISTCVDKDTKNLPNIMCDRG